MARGNKDTPRIATARVPLQDEDGNNIYEGETLSPGEADADRIAQEQSDDVLQALSQVEGAAEVRWTVWRLLPLERQGVCGELMTAELNAMTIRKKYGPGKYEIRGTHPNGTYAGRRRLWVAENPGEVTSTLPVPSGSAFDLQSFLAQQKMAQKEDLKFWAGLLVPLLAPMLVELFKRKDSGIGELVAALRGLKEVSGGDSATAKLAEVRDLIGVVKDLMPEGGSTGSTWPDLIREGVRALPTLAPALAAMQRPQPGGATLPPGARLIPSGAPMGGQIPPVAPPPPATPSPNDPPPQAPPMLELLQWLQMQLPILAQKAQTGADPIQYAESLADLMPPNVNPLELRDWLIRNDWWQLFSGFYPPIAPYQLWFTQLRGRLLEMIDEAIEDAQQGQSLEEAQQQAGPIPGGE